MPGDKRNHNSSRALVCVICYYKIFRNGKVLKNNIKLTHLIREKYPLLSNNDPDDMADPNGLCSSCSRTLYRSNKNSDVKVPYLKACKYANSDIARSSVHTRTCSNATPCDICLIARSKYKPSSHDPCNCHTCTQYNKLPTTKTQITIEPSKTPQFTATNLIDIQTQQNMSDNQIIKVASSLLSICGHGSVEPGFRDKLGEISKKAEQFYSILHD